MTRWTSGNPMPAAMYDAAVARERQQRQIVNDDFGPITKAYAITQLKRSEKWLGDQQSHKSRSPEDMMVVQNIMLGCCEMLGQCGVDFKEWASLRKGRFRLLKQCKRTFKTQAGHRALRLLIRLTISSLESAIWLEDSLIQATHLPRWTKARSLSADQKARIGAATRARAAVEREKEEAQRAARFSLFSYDVGGESGFSNSVS